MEDYMERYKFLLDTFLHVNDKAFNNLQRELLELVLDPESGPEEYAAAVNLLNNSIKLYNQAGWKPTKEAGDAVNRPKHYDVFPMEPTYFLVRLEELTGSAMNWCLSNFVKYVCRYRFKNGVEDLAKAMRNLAMYIRYLDGDTKWST